MNTSDMWVATALIVGTFLACRNMYIWWKTPRPIKVKPELEEVILENMESPKKEVVKGLIDIVNQKNK
jgi:hypothetical protein